MEVTRRGPPAHEIPTELIDLRLHGLRVVLVCAPWQQSQALILRVGHGYGDDPADRAGLAHLGEHERIAHASTIVAPLGSTISGQTDPAWTDYQLAVPAAYWQHGLLRALALLHPGRLAEGKLANEVKAVLIELARTAARPALRLGPLLASRAAAGSDLAAVGTATPESVRSITTSDLDGFLSRCYRPVSCQLVVTSPVRGAEIADFLEARVPVTSATAPGPAPPLPHAPPPPVDPSLSGTLAMTVLRPRSVPDGLLADELAHLHLTDRRGHLDRVAAPLGHRIAGATTLVGRRSRLTMLSWGHIAVPARLGNALRCTSALSSDDFTQLRERLYLRRGFELQTPLGLARQVLQSATGEGLPPVTREALEQVSLRQVDEALGTLGAAADLWHVVDGVPRRLEA